MTDNVKYLIDNIEKIKDVLLTSRLGILSRDILTKEEIEKNNITLEMLEEIKLSTAIFRNNIIFIIELPNYSEEVYEKLYVQPIPNVDGKLQLKVKEKLYLSKGKEIYVNTKEKKNLYKISDKCIENLYTNNMTCNLEENKNNDIVEISNDNIVIINSPLEKINQNCNQQNFEIEGNYEIKIKDCQLEYQSKIYSRKEYAHEILLPNIIKNITYTKIHNITFENLQYQNIKNLKEIHELVHKHNVTNNTLYSVITIVIILAILYMYLKFKNSGSKNITNVNLPSVSFKPMKDLKGGGVMTEPACALETVIRNTPNTVVYADDAPLRKERYVF